MCRLVDGESSDATRTCALSQDRNTQLDGRIGESALGVHFHDRRAVLRQQLGHRVRLHLTGLDRPQGPFDAVDAMRLTRIAFPSNYDAGHRTRLD